MNCIHCKGDVPKNAARDRIIICNNCTFRLVVTIMRKNGEEMPDKRSQRLSEDYKKRREGKTIQKLKPIGGRYA